ncbi:MAG: TraR/DksA C4-type zinc finger protein [Desulfobacterales bacterium]
MDDPNEKGNKKYSEIKQDLINRRRELWNLIREDLEKEGREEYGKYIQNIMDRGDTALAELKESTVFSYIQMKSDEIESIDQALKKIENGTYGICDDCGKDISLKRLQVMPYALRCRKCQENWERVHNV